MEVKYLFYLKALKYLQNQNLNYQIDLSIFLGINRATAKTILDKMELMGWITIVKTGRKKQYNLIKDVKLTKHDTYFLKHKKLSQTDKIMLIHMLDICNVYFEVTMQRIIKTTKSSMTPPNTYKILQSLQAKKQVIRTAKHIKRINKTISVLKIVEISQEERLKNG